MTDLDLSLVDVHEFLSMLDVENIRVEAQEARFSCPYPAHSFGDSNPSAYMNLDTTAFICFSCGESGNAITFLADLKNVPRVTAKNWIAQKWAPQYAQIDDLRGFIEGMFERESKTQLVDPFVPLDEAEFEKRRVDWHGAGAFGMWWDYVLNRGFTPEVLTQFGVCYDQISDRPCLTVRTPSGELAGFKGRAYREDQWPKYMVLGDTERTLAERGEIYGFRPYDASRHVFGAHIARPINGRLVVIEGEFNVVSAHQKRITNSVGPSGSTLSDVQVESICSMCDEVVLLFDTDSATVKSYTTAHIKILRAIDAFERFVDVRVCPDHDGDPAEMSEYDLRSLVDSSVTSTMHKVLRYVS